MFFSLKGSQALKVLLADVVLVLFNFFSKLIYRLFQNFFPIKLLNIKTTRNLYKNHPQINGVAEKNEK